MDAISPIVLKHCAYALASPLHQLFTASITSGAVPPEWKMYKIIAVYKSGDKTSVRNYHSISLLCIVSKVLARLVNQPSFHSTNLGFKRMLQSCNNYSSTLTSLLHPKTKQIPYILTFGRSLIVPHTISSQLSCGTLVSLVPYGTGYIIKPSVSL